jgi:hypothetical protein
MMVGSSMSLCPLEDVSEADLKTLCRTLWDWKLCTECTVGNICSARQCPWNRSAKLERFFDFYKIITSGYVPEAIHGPYALRSHGDLFAIIQLLKEKSDVPRSVLTEQYFHRRGQGDKPNEIDQNRAFNLALGVLTMVNCSAATQPYESFEHGSQPVIWRSDESVQQFIRSTFPISGPPGLNHKDTYMDMKEDLTASNLEKIAG